LHWDRPPFNIDGLGVLSSVLPCTQNETIPHRVSTVARDVAFKVEGQAEGRTDLQGAEGCKASGKIATV